MNSERDLYRGLLRDEALMANLIQSLIDVLVVVDRDAVVQFINRAGEDLLGHPSSELVGQPVGAIVTDENLQFFRAIRELMTTGESRHCDLELVTRSGEKIPATFNGSVLRGPGNRIEAVVGVIRDVREIRRLVRELEDAKVGLENTVQKRTRELAAAKTRAEQAYEELKTAQAQLIHAEKMSSLGQLAAGVAHEINTPIGFVGANLRTLREYVWDLLQLAAGYEGLLGAVERSDFEAARGEAERGRALAQRLNARALLEDLAHVATESEGGLNRVRRIVQDLKAFSRSEEQEQTSVDINEGVESTLAIARNELKYKAEVIKELGPVPAILGYPQQLNQVILNLLVNAAHAFDERTKTSVEGDGSPSKGTIWIRTFLRGEAVVLEVEDTGCGIAPEHMAKIFDPFFTTKPVGKGTGLGLSISYGIVRKHSGTIEVESHVGQGTRFRVVLPVQAPAADETEKPGEEPERRAA
ncbi:MAG: PAS domain S-box protein [Nitrospirae bacterium]|nr:PAS domain S-box protein [Nitrospirota bacterium]